MNTSNASLWDLDLIRKYDLAGPRYTSYPTALQFRDDIGYDDWVEAVEASNALAAPLSLYFHIPFCDTVCYYCACNRIITANKEKAIPYLKHLLHEVELQAAHIDASRPVQQLHFGGGTPTYISDEQMASIIGKVSEHFLLLGGDEGEYSLEIHPASVDARRIERLRSLGFNRISMGIQDFDPQVQRAVNRFNSPEEVERLCKAIRQAKYQSLSMDLIYGLPHQTTASFAQTIARIIDLSPNRISLFNYAHLPERFKTQRQMDASALPESQQKLEILHQSIDALLAAGYVYIGMDHFARPDDELAIAQREGHLHRNFQGYSTRQDCDLFAFGVSSISSIGNTFFQNAKVLAAYSEALAASALPIERGCRSDQDDLIRRAVIHQLLCQFELDFAVIERAFAIRFVAYFTPELDRLRELASDGLIQLDDSKIVVRSSGRLLARSICMVFDKYLQPQHRDLSHRYSRII